MPVVYDFPPVAFTAWGEFKDDPRIYGTGLSGAVRASQNRATRRVLRCAVGGIGAARDQGGALEMLRDYLDGQVPLVRMMLRGRQWVGATAGRQVIGTHALTWTSGPEAMVWASGGRPLGWEFGTPIPATPGRDRYDFIDCDGIPEGAPIYVGERLAVGGVFAKVIRRTVGRAGLTRIYVNTALPAGMLTLGAREAAVFWLPDFPQPVQVAGQNYSYSFEMREAFAADYDDGFTFRDPWGGTA